MRNKGNRGRGQRSTPTGKWRYELKSEVDVASDHAQV
jgi:hypothetical protein